MEIAGRLSYMEILSAVVESVCRYQVARIPYLPTKRTDPTQRTV